jgi:hypothetical protein
MLLHNHRNVVLKISFCLDFGDDLFRKDVFINFIDWFLFRWFVWLGGITFDFIMVVADLLSNDGRHFFKSEDSVSGVFNIFGIFQVTKAWTQNCFTNIASPER